MQVGDKVIINSGEFENNFGNIIECDHINDVYDIMLQNGICEEFSCLDFDILDNTLSPEDCGINVMKDWLSF